MKEKLVSFLNWFFKTAVLALLASVGCRIVLYFATNNGGAILLPNITIGHGIFAWSKSTDMVFLNVYIFFVLIFIIISVACALLKQSLWAGNMIGTGLVFLVLSALIIYSDLKTGHAAAFIKKSGMLIYIFTVPWLTLLAWAVFAGVPAWMTGKSEDVKQMFAGKPEKPV